MNLENSTKDVIAKQLEEGIVEKLIAEQLKKSIVNALDSMMGRYGDVTEIIEEQLKSVMIPYLENYDYSKYITKLDTVLVDVLESTAFDNKKIIENFKDLMLPVEKDEISVIELFEMWKEYVAHEVDTSDLEIIYEDEPMYQNVDVSFEVEYSEERSWSDFDHAKIVFECEDDEKVNCEIGISNWKKYDGNKWTINLEKTGHSIESLRYLNKFEIQLMRLVQNRTKLIVDSDFENDEVEVKAEPEASFY